MSLQWFSFLTFWADDDAGELPWSTPATSSGQKAKVRLKNNTNNITNNDTFRDKKKCNKLVLFVIFCHRIKNALNLKLTITLNLPCFDGKLSLNEVNSHIGQILFIYLLYCTTYFFSYVTDYAQNCGGGKVKSIWVTFFGGQKWANYDKKHRHMWVA